MTTNSASPTTLVVHYSTFAPLINTVAADFDFTVPWSPSGGNAVGVMLASLLDSILHHCRSKMTTEGTSEDELQECEPADKRSAAILLALQPSVLRSALDAALIPEALRKGALDAADREVTWLGKTTAAPLRSQFDGRHGDFLKRLEEALTERNGSSETSSENVQPGAKESESVNSAEFPAERAKPSKEQSEVEAEDLGDTGLAAELSVKAYGAVVYLTAALEFVATEIIMEVFDRMEKQHKGKVETQTDMDGQESDGEAVDDKTVIAAISADANLARQFLSSTMFVLSRC